MTDDTPHPQLRAVEVRVCCMLHGMQYMRGSAAVYNLGHGRTHQTTGEASCDKCPDDKWLRIELFESEVLEVDNKEYAAALMATFEAEIGTPEPEEEVADEEDESTAGTVDAPQADSAGVHIPFQRRPLGSYGNDGRGGSGGADGSIPDSVRQSA